MLLEGKKALVTGGSRGIGREIVLAFLKEGASVWYVDIAEGDSLAEYTEIASANGTKVSFRECNVADEESVGAAIGEILSESDGLDILVNNAGITRDNLFLRMSDDEWDNVIAVNLTSVFSLIRGALRGMMRRRYGRVVNIASISGMIGNPGQANYSASKAGLIGMTKSLAREVAKRGITANCIAPGFIETPMTATLNEKQMAAIASAIPASNFGKPEDVASAALYLASDEASYVTGHTIHVNGGMVMV